MINAGKIVRASDFVRRRKIHVAREWSSTIVKKYLYPSIVSTEKGPQTFMCNNSKVDLQRLFGEIKDNFFCFAK